MNKHRYYLDTNIFLDYIRRRDEDTIAFINNANAHNMELVTSYLTYLEILDKECEDYFVQREFKNKKTFDVIRRNIYNRNLKKNELNLVTEKTTEIMGEISGMVQFTLFYLNDRGWGHAMELMSEINLNSGDAVHLATAIESECDVLLTKDQHFKRNAKEKIECMDIKGFKKQFLMQK